MKMVIVAALSAAVNFFCLKENIVGRWESKPSISGNTTGVVFKSDHTYTSYVNKKPFTTGVYSVQDSLLLIKENGCEYTGTYKTVFFAADDSLRLQPVTDSCVERAKGISRLTLGRTKQYP